jgi:creatinine amidohydrolase
MSQAPSPPVYLSELTYPAVERLLAADPIVLLPIGATEAHGPHLPLGTDVYLSEELARRTQRELAALLLPSVIAPSLAYAVTEYGAAFAGTVSLPSPTARLLYSGVCRGLLRAGFRRICLLNSHLEPAHIAALRDSVAEVNGAPDSPQRVVFPDHTERRFARTLTDEYKRGNCHAGRYETSLLLASQPQLIDEALRPTLPENSADLVAAMRAGIPDFAGAGGPRAYFGAPAAATASEGDDIYHRLWTIALCAMTEAWPDRLPPRPSL